MVLGDAFHRHRLGWLPWWELAHLFLGGGVLPVGIEEMDEAEKPFVAVRCVLLGEPIDDGVCPGVGGSLCGQGIVEILESALEPESARNVSVAYDREGAKTESTQTLGEGRHMRPELDGVFFQTVEGRVQARQQ